MIRGEVIRPLRIAVSVRSCNGVEIHCCEEMRQEVDRVCDRHPDRHDCPDCLVDYSPANREYGLLIHDGGSSSRRIRFCPWCGIRLPESLRDKY